MFKHGIRSNCTKLTALDWLPILTILYITWGFVSHNFFSTTACSYLEGPNKHTFPLTTDHMPPARAASLATIAVTNGEVAVRSHTLGKTSYLPFARWKPNGSGFKLKRGCLENIENSRRFFVVFFFRSVLFPHGRTTSARENVAHKTLKCLIPEEGGVQPPDVTQENPCRMSANGTCWTLTSAAVRWAKADLQKLLRIDSSCVRSVSLTRH